MSIEAQEESAMHGYLGIMQTIATPYCIRDGDTFSNVPELPPVDCLPLPGSILPISLSAQVPKHALLRASSACPPLIRVRCSHHHNEETHRVHEVLMLCAVEKISQRPHGVELHATLRVICPCDLVDSHGMLTDRGEVDALKGSVRARDCSNSVFNANHARSQAMRCSISVEASRPGCCFRSLGYSFMNEQLMALCNVPARLNSAAIRARQVFGHVPVTCSDPLSAVWQLLSLCCLSPHERVEALAPSASIFSLLELLRLRLETSKLFCRSCYTYVCQYADFCAVSSACAVSTFINPAAVVYEVVTVKTANVRSGRFTSDQASWFPGFTWSHATCRHCETHLGATLSRLHWNARVLVTLSNTGWAYSGRSNGGQPCSFLGLCVSHLAHQPPSVADLLQELQKSGALSGVVVEEIAELLSPHLSGIPPVIYTRLHRILISSIRIPLSEHERLMLIQLDGNLRLGQSGQHHEDLSGIQMHHEVESVDSDEVQSGPSTLSGSSISSDSDCDDDEL